MKKQQSKRGAVYCQCGAKAVLRPAGYVHDKLLYGHKLLYVCSRYPQCDCYVSAHSDTRRPMGTLADKELRTLRINAHTAFSRIWEMGIMRKKEAYFWMGIRLGLTKEQAHIGLFSKERCRQLISLCRHLTEFYQNNKAAS